MRVDCNECGEPATCEWDEGADYAYWTNGERFTPVCADCWTVRDNEEPPEPDGEAFRGGEAAAFNRDEMARIQRELK